MTDTQLGICEYVMALPADGSHRRLFRYGERASGGFAYWVWLPGLAKPRWHRMTCEEFGRLFRILEIYGVTKPVGNITPPSP